jgi:hypothetical protein
MYQPESDSAQYALIRSNFSSHIRDFILVAARLPYVLSAWPSPRYWNTLHFAINDVFEKTPPAVLKTLSFSLEFLLASFDFLCQILFFFAKIQFNIYVRVFQEVQAKIYDHKWNRVFYLNHLSYLKIFIGVVVF